MIKRLKNYLKRNQPANKQVLEELLEQCNNKVVESKEEFLYNKNTTWTTYDFNENSKG